MDSLAICWIKNLLSRVDDAKIIQHHYNEVRFLLFMSGAHLLVPEHLFFEQHLLALTRVNK